LPFKEKEDNNRYMRQYYRKQKQKQLNQKQKTEQLAEALSLTFKMSLEKDGQKY